MSSDIYELLMRRHKDEGDYLSIGTMPAGATLGEALRTLADAVDGAVGDGCKLIGSWGIGFQFRRGNDLYDLRLVSETIQLRCFYRTGRKPTPETETQEARAIPSLKYRRLSRSQIYQNRKSRL
jgi:hypothetical protein